MTTSQRVVPQNWLYRGSLFLVVATFLLIIAGGLVTSHQAGLSVPDWPKSYGRWFPPMVGNIFWEHGHRMVAGFVGLYTLTYVILIQFFETRVWVKKFSWTLVLAVLSQALLGGLTVIFLLPSPISIAHACLGQIFFCLAVSTAYFMSPGFFQKGDSSREASSSPLLFRFCLFTTGLLFLQLVLGAAVRHTGSGIVFHILNAFTVLTFVLIVTVGTGRAHLQDSRVSKAAVVLGLLTLIQIFLGIGAFVFTHMIPKTYTPGPGQIIFTTLHQSLGAWILAASLWLTLRLKS